MAMVIVLNLTSVVANRWVLGDWVCTVVSIATTILFPVENVLVCFVNISKLSVMVYPIRALSRSATPGHLMAGVAWLISICIVSVALNTGSNIGDYQPILYKCVGVKFKVNYILVGLLSLSLLLPQLITIGSVIVLSIHLTCRTHLQIRKQGLALLLTLSAVYVFSFLPFYTYSTYAKFWHGNDSSSDYNFHPEIFLTFSSIFYLGYTLNPLIYYLTLASFREYTNNY